MKSISWVLAFLSLGFLWAFNPVDLKAVWLLSNSEKIASPFAAEITTTLTSSMTSFITILSLILISMGTLLAWFKYKPGTLKLTPIEASVGTGGFLSRLSYNNWFLDYIYDKIFIKPILRLSIGFKRFEKSVIDKLVDLIGWITVILAHIIGWVDRALVDGLVNTSVYMVGQAGMITKSIQGNKIQSYIIWAVLGILIILFLAL